MKNTVGIGLVAGIILGVGAVKLVERLPFLNRMMQSMTRCLSSHVIEAAVLGHHLFAFAFNIDGLSVRLESREHS